MTYCTGTQQVKHTKDTIQMDKWKVATNLKGCATGNQLQSEGLKQSHPRNYNDAIPVCIALVPDLNQTPRLHAARCGD